MGTLRDLAWPVILPDRAEKIVTAKAALLDKRGFPLAWEHTPPRGQAALWYQAVIREVPPSGREVARQVARLCGDDSQVTLSWRALADAVGRADKAGRLRAYAERGVQALDEAGWLRRETTGKGCAARTTWYLMPGEMAVSNGQRYTRRVPSSQ